jgi:hypothetical protein
VPTTGGGWAWARGPGRVRMTRGGGIDSAAKLRGKARSIARLILPAKEPHPLPLLLLVHPGQLKAMSC